MVSLRSLVAGVALVMGPVVSAVTAAQVAQGFNSLESQSKDLQGPAS